MPRSAPALSPAQLAAWTRQRLVSLASVALESMLPLVQDHLNALMDEAVPSRELQARRDVWVAYQGAKSAWLQGTVGAWQAQLVQREQPAPARGARLELAELGLQAESEVENKIAASRLALALMEGAAQEVNDLRKRVRSLQGNQELAATDLLNPEALLLPLVEQWQSAGLSWSGWQMVAPVVQRHLNDHLRKAYAQCNADLIARGVLPVIGFEAVRQPDETISPSAWSGGGRVAPAAAAAPQAGPGRLAQADGVPGLSAPGTGSASGWAALPGWVQGHGIGQGMLAQAGQALAAVFGAGPQVVASPAVLDALAHQAPLAQAAMGAMPLAGAAPALLQQVAGELRDRATELKKEAASTNEKAVIELVGLMFQAILQEDRIPPGVRLWFARLQMPVLRLALTDPGFFQKHDHPARRLIDHMGSCVMGFEGGELSSKLLEAEIRRIVQVIEQYPDSGERVFAKVYEEFQAFLRRHLTADAAAQKVVSVVEQLERKETLAVQYTIELRTQLADMPVRDEVKDFLFKRWTEVLALATLRHGSLADETQRYRATATDLIWATAAKPDREARAALISQLPDLLQRLRAGMALLGMSDADQTAQIKVLNHVLSDAFTARNQPIDRARVQALSERLAQFEDLVADGSDEDLALDAQSLTELLGVDASALDVLQEGGAEQPGPAMLAWARELDLGAWFGLQLGATDPIEVQYAWRSPLGHMHLLTARSGHGYLIQTQRLAAYLKEGLLVPLEEERLSVRATQSAVRAVAADPALLR